MLQIVSVHCGEKYSDLYLDRLYGMVTRHMPAPFAFTCFTDRRRKVSEHIQQVDCAGWGLSGWFNKLKLFDKSAMPFESMLYLDLSLIVKADLTPMVDFVRQHPFVIVRDWHYDCFNSCAMWITRTARTQQVWDDYAQGITYRTRHHGDQDYIHAVFRAHGWLPETTCFPESMIVSYKNLRRMRRSQPQRSEELLADSIILKFHGFPKPHELLMPAVELPLKRRLFFFGRDYLVPQIREWWQ